MWNPFYFVQKTLYLRHMPNGNEVGIFGQPMRWYVDRAEWSWAGLSLVFFFGFLVSYWVEVSYLEIVAPLALVAQVVTAIVATYLVGIRDGATIPQTLVVCALVGVGGGAVNALLSFIRFFYPWLLLNLVIEPVWSALLTAGVSLVTIGFFQLPKLIKKEQPS